MTQVLAERYELGPLLGSGGMANVYEARDQLLDRRVALKLLRDDLPEGRGRQSVLSEARAAAQFSHPHAVAVYDIGKDDHRPFIVMELVEGCSLAELLARRGSLAPEQAVAVTGQTLSALEAAHKRGLVHRDIKPANILLPACRLPDGMDDLGGVKLADFGIAKGIREAAGEMTMAGKVIGTPTYLSPEQVSGQSASPQSDLYSAGVVLYEMLAGRPPFASESPVAMALAHQQQTPQRLSDLRPDLPEGLVELVHQALNKDPYERYAGAADMREALRNWRGGAAAVAPTLIEHASPAPRSTPDRADDGPVMNGRPPRMAGWRPAVVVGSIALIAIVLIFLASALGLGDGDAVGDSAATEPPPADVVDDPALEEAPVEEPAAEEPPAEEPPADDGFGIPGLPDTTGLGADGLREVIQRLPGRVVGERQEDLAQGLQEVSEAAPADVPEEAQNLQGDVQEWVVDGELTERIGRLVEVVLNRLIAG